MEKLFVPKAQSLQLEELGFDEPCFKEYHGNNLLNNSLGDDVKNSELEEIYDGVITAPTFSQAFRWFREKYGVYIQPNRIVDSEGIWYYFSISTKRTDVCEGSFIYEEAELACLTKLIEIVKENGEIKV